MEIVDELVRDLDLQRWRVVKTELKCLCVNPTHPDRKPTNFSINLITGKAHCFSCGFAAKDFNQLYTLLLKDVPDWAKDLTVQGDGFKRQGVIEKAMATAKAPEYVARNAWLTFLSRNPEGAFDKLEKRGVTREAIDIFKVGYNEQKDLLFFPAITQEGNLVGWAERSDAYASRYLIQPEGTDKQNMLFGAHLLDPSTKHDIVLVEGVVDAMKLWQEGYKVLALFGSEVLDNQFKKIMEIANTVTVVPDNDKGGLHLIDSFTKRFKTNLPVYAGKVPPFLNDLGEAHATPEILRAVVDAKIRV